MIFVGKFFLFSSIIESIENLNNRAKIRIPDFDEFAHLKVCGISKITNWAAQSLFVIIQCVHVLVRLFSDYLKSYFLRIRNFVHLRVLLWLIEIFKFVLETV